MNGGRKDLASLDFGLRGSVFFGFLFHNFVVDFVL